MVHVAQEVPLLPLWQGKQDAVVREGVHGHQYCLGPSTVFRFVELNKD
ncbi:hypothetical protein [Streptomyces sp. SCL15-6]|nr:hypothetical protein [Streptomyces sp. SCL15-6]